MRPIFKKIFHKRPSSRDAVSHLDLREGQLGLCRLDDPTTSSSNVGGRGGGGGGKGGGDGDGGQECYDVDIVAIHGFNGDARESWTHVDSGVFWLQHLLPHDLPGSRIYSYGYPAPLLFNRSTAQIRHYATQLLSALVCEREDDEKARPIVFICHSFGGIVFKQAMIIAFEEEDRFGQVWLWSKGVVFLGTPHRGSRFADLGKVLGDMAKALHVSVNTPLLKDLAQSSAALLALAQSFRPRASALRIETFYETEITVPMGKVIVDEASAVLGVAHEQATPLNANHQEMVRFGGESDQNYQLVSRALKRMVKHILSELSSKDAASSLQTETSLDDAEKACLALLNTTDVAAVEARLDPRAAGTLRWVIDSPVFAAWASASRPPSSGHKKEGSSGRPRALWVTGYAGSGKTTLAAYVAGHLSEQLPPPPPAMATPVVRFFCDGKIAAQRDGSAILRSIIYQLVVRRRKLLLKVRRAYHRQGPQLFVRFEALWSLFLDLTAGNAVIVVLDALDECDDVTQRSVVHAILRLFDGGRKTRVGGEEGGGGGGGKGAVEDSWAGVKFFITCRPTLTSIYPVPQEGSTHAHLRFEEQQDSVGEDVKLVIRQRLAQIFSRPSPSTGSKTTTNTKKQQELRAHLESVLIAKAETTFLWVTLVLSLLESPHVQLSPASIPTIAQHLRPDLASLYAHLLSLIPAPHRHGAGTILRFLLAAARPLSLSEISILGEVQCGLRAGEGVGLGVTPAALGPLVRISQGCVYLVHHTLKEYLMDLAADSADPLAGDFGVDLRHATLLLAECCVEYLLGDYLVDGDSSVHASSAGSSPVISATVNPSHASNEDDDGDDGPLGLATYDLEDVFMFRDKHAVEEATYSVLTERHGLYDYAALYWAAHFAQYNEDAVSTKMHHLAITLCSSSNINTPGPSNWFRYVWLKNGMSEPLYPAVVDALLITSFFGHSKTLQLFLEDYSSSSSSSSRQVLDQSTVASALYWAARNGHASCVTQLLRWATAITLLVKINNELPLSAAAECGQLHSVRALLADPRTGADVTNARRRTPLSLAAGNGHSDIVELLLPSADVNVNAPDRSGAPPWLWAMHSNSVATIKLFLRSAHVDHNAIDAKGQGAAAWAAELGHDGALTQLLKSTRPRIDLALKDAKGRTPLALAAAAGHLSTVRLLVRSGRADPLAQGSTGRTALSLAAAQADARIVHCLVNAAPAAVDVPDDAGWAPLAWALNPPGYADNVAVLLQAGGIDINRRDNTSGRTLLAWAATYGLVSITRSLLCATVSLEGERGLGKVDVERRDNDGRTPFSHACGNGCVGVARLLLETGEVDVNSRDSTGRTPLSWAASGTTSAEMLSFLMQLPEVEVDGKDSSGCSARDYARQFGREDVFLAARPATA